jgi:alkanesulfonate monooxygenase SsuD/methylene tetrahydromethanopterin reductase-like flavin-dependent oxidoreductase (luciferase family)
VDGAEPAAGRLRLGLFGGAQSSPDDPAHGYQDYLGFLLEAEALGYHGCFLTEHHFTGWGQVSAPLHMLSWLAARTTRLRLGTAVMVLAWHNPMLLAEQAATVDVLSGGRLDLGIGRGYRHNEFHGFAMDAGEAEARFAESLAVMTRAWTSRERFSHHGTFWRFDDVVLEPRPVQVPHPPLWVSAGREASIRAAAMGGLRLLLDQFTPVDTLRERIAVYRDAAGERFDPAMIAVARDVYVAESAAELEDAFRRRAIGHQRMIDAARAPGASSGSHILAWADRPEARTEAALYGSVAQVEDKLAALREAGVTTVLCNILGQHRPALRKMAALGTGP